MAAFDFPPTPAVGTLYPLVAEVGKPQYRWNGSEWTAATFDPAGYVRKSGDAMTGALSLAGDPTQALHAVPKQYLDAQRQVIQLGGVKQIDVQVPTNAVVARFTISAYYPTATATYILMQPSFSAGVFHATVGHFSLFGFYNDSAAATVFNWAGIATYPGMLITIGHTNAALPLYSSGLIRVKRPSTSQLFTANSVISSFGGTGLNGISSGSVASIATSALSMLALRFVNGSSDNWVAESYLYIEWF